MTFWSAPWAFRSVRFGPVNRRMLDEPPDSFGNSRANSAFASELGEEEETVWLELVVTDPMSGRNGTATTSSATQKRTGYQGCRTTPRARPPNSRNPSVWSWEGPELTPPSGICGR